MADTTEFIDHLRNELQGLRDAGLFKTERILSSPQGAVVRTADGREVIKR
jgi:glycine C-acetyltransferase